MWLNASVPAGLPNPVSLRLVDRHAVSSDAANLRQRRHQQLNVSLAVVGPNWIDMDIAPRGGVTITNWSLRYFVVTVFKKNFVLIVYYLTV
jgi:hypothetical protein